MSCVTYEPRESNYWNVTCRNTCFMQLVKKLHCKRASRVGISNWNVAHSVCRLFQGCPTRKSFHPRIYLHSQYKRQSFNRLVLLINHQRIIIYGINVRDSIKPWLARRKRFSSNSVWSKSLQKSSKNRMLQRLRYTCAPRLPCRALMSECNHGYYTLCLNDLAASARLPDWNPTSTQPFARYPPI